VLIFFLWDHCNHAVLPGLIRHMFFTLICSLCLVQCLFSLLLLRQDQVTAGTTLDLIFYSFDLISTLFLLFIVYRRTTWQWHSKDIGREISHEEKVRERKKNTIEQQRKARDKAEFRRSNVSRKRSSLTQDAMGSDSMSPEISQPSQPSQSSQFSELSRKLSSPDPPQHFPPPPEQWIPPTHNPPLPPKPRISISKSSSQSQLQLNESYADSSSSSSSQMSSGSLDSILVKAPSFSAERLLDSLPDSPDIVDQPDTPDASTADAPVSPNPFEHPLGQKRTPLTDLTNSPSYTLDDTGDLP